jgi:hypothetical protein
MTTEFEGGCTCGAVRYRLAAAPMFVNCCHCTWCQRETGGAFVINAIIETAQIEVTRGASQPVATPSESGRGQIIHRCPTCHVALWSHYGRRTAIAFLRAGALDDAGAVTPGAFIFTRSKLPWVVLPPDIPAFEIYYEMETLWPPESQARRAAALSEGG